VESESRKTRRAVVSARRLHGKNMHHIEAARTAIKGGGGRHWGDANCKVGEVGLKHRKGRRWVEQGGEVEKRDEAISQLKGGLRWGGAETGKYWRNGSAGGWTELGKKDTFTRMAFCEKNQRYGGEKREE